MANRRSQMVSDINADRGTPSARPTPWGKPLTAMSDQELLYWATNEGDVSRRRELAAEMQRRRGDEPSTTADLANETRPVPEVPVADPQWRGGKFDWQRVRDEMAEGRRRDEEDEARKIKEWEDRYGQGTYGYRDVPANANRNRAGMGMLSEQQQADMMREAQLADLRRRKAEQDAVRGHNAQVADLERQLRGEPEPWNPTAAVDRAAEELNRRYPKPTGTPADIDPVESSSTPIPDAPDMSSTDVLPGDQPGTVRKWNPETKRYDIVAVGKPAADGPQPFYGRTVPGPVSKDGTPVAASREFGSEDESVGYDRRRQIGSLTPEERADRDQRAMGVTWNTEDGRAKEDPGTGLAASERDIAMRGRGFMPVEGGYSVEAVDDPAAPLGAPGRFGRRPDLENAGYVSAPVEGPLGHRNVYRPGAELRMRMQNARDQSIINDVIARTGMEPAQAAQLQRAGGVEAVTNAGRMMASNDLAQRRKNVVLQAQARQRPMNFLNNPDADPWAKRVMSEAILRSGRPGATPLDVEGQQMGNMQNVMQQMATGYATTLQQSPQVEMMRQQYEAKLDAEAAAHADAVMTKMGYDPTTGLGQWSGKPMTEEERRRVAVAVERRYPGRGQRIAANIPVAAAAPQPAARGGDPMDGI